MKKFTKVCLICALLVFVLGIGCAIAAAAMGANPVRAIKDMIAYGKTFSEEYGRNFDEKFLVDEELELLEEYKKDEIDQLDISIGYGGVVLRPVSGNSVSVWVKEEDSKTNSLKVEKNGRTLSMKDTAYDEEFKTVFSWEGNGWNWGWNPTWNLKGHKAVIAFVDLPEKEYKKLEAHVQMGAVKCYDMTVEKMEFYVDAGAVYTEGLLTCDSSVISVDMGEAVLDKVKCGDMQVSVDMGKAELGSISCKSLETEVNMGSCIVQYAEAEDVKAECDMGEINLCMAGEPEDYYIDSDVDMGDISIENHARTKDRSADNKMELDCDMGEIHVSFAGK